MERIENLPTPVKWGVGSVGVAGIATGGGWLFGWGEFFIFLGVLIVLLALFLSGWLLWRGWQRKKRGERFGGSILGGVTGSPTAISDPKQLAALDQLRKQFEKGVAEFRSRGKNLYALPWYVFAGPPGSGKTQAIAHSSLKFPPGMNDPLQGVGGTVNMDWWFTADSIILDTAGRLMFEEVKPGQAGEWQEFLKLLKRHRPNCPINGLFLAISVEDLIKDSSEKIEEKAGQIARQLDVIQRVLDVRFPVYVIVTKCDLLTGFREFFDGITDPQLQSQMLGWSNPEPLDTPFKPELVDQYLHSVTQRLKRRRLGLLRDPAPEVDKQRRADEVDSLFALPNSLALIGPRLRRYLENTFVTGEWSAKPLFLRGIYFTSSMREGSALDEELAKAIGVPVEQLPPGPKWERDRAFFLRDLFLEKVFPENGLVTRASNATVLLRKRQVALAACAFAGLAIFLLFSAIGMSTFKESLGKQTPFWKAAAASWRPWEPTTNTDWAQREFWIPILKPADEPGPPYRDRSGDNLVDKIGREYVKHAAFHSRLREFAEQPIKTGIFRPLKTLKDIDDRRKRAQRIVFQRSVIEPLLIATRRELMRAPDGGSNNVSLELQAEALAVLVDLEWQALEKRQDRINLTDAKSFLLPLLAYLSSKPPKDFDANLAATMTKIYSQGDSDARWPYGDLKGGSTLSKNLAIDEGIKNFFTSLQRTVVSSAKDLDRLRNIRDATEAFDTAERNFTSNKAAGDYFTALSRLEATGAELTRQLDDVASSRILISGPALLSNSFQRLVVKTSTELGASLAKIQAAANRGSNAFIKEPDKDLFHQVNRRIDQQRDAALSEINRLYQFDPARLQRIDDWLLSDLGGAPTNYFYRKRLTIHEMGFARSNLIGQAWRPFLEWQTNLNHLRDRATVYFGKGREPFHTHSLNFAEVARTAGLRNLPEVYAKEVKSRLDQFAQFPLLRVEGSDLRLVQRLPAGDARRANGVLAGVYEDLKSPAMTNIQSPVAPIPEGLSNHLVSLALIGAVLDGPSKCKVSFLPPGTPIREDQKWTDHLKIVQLKSFQAVKTDGKTNVELGTIGVEETLDIKVSHDQDNMDPLEQFKLGEWGVLELLQHVQYVETPPNAPSSKWVVKIPFSDSVLKKSGLVGALRLGLEFERPLPPLKDWPTRKEFDNLNAR